MGLEERSKGVTPLLQWREGWQDAADPAASCCSRCLAVTCGPWPALGPQHSSCPCPAASRPPHCDTAWLCFNFASSFKSDQIGEVKNQNSLCEILSSRSVRGFSDLFIPQDHVPLVLRL